MQTAVIIDAVLAAILVLCTVLGWRRGAFKSVIGIVIVIAALIGAGVIAEQGAPVAAKAIAPIVSERIEARFDRAAQEMTPSFGESSEEEAAGLFSAMGLYQRTAESLAKDAAEQMRETGKALVQAAAESMLLSVARAVLFLLSFVILMVILKILSKILGLLTAVPGLHLMNAVGGGAFGFLQGCLILFALVWAMQFFGEGIPPEMLEQSTLLRIFAAMNPIAVVSGL